MPVTSAHAAARRPLAVFAAVLLGLGAGACAGSSAGARHASARGAAAAGATTNRWPVSDRDNDGDHNDDDARVLNYGHAAAAADRSVIVALVKRYFAAAAAKDGARACRMLVPLTAEMAVEANGRSPLLRGHTCAVVMSKLFGLHHRELTEKSAALRVIAVRLAGRKGIVLLDFTEIPEVRQISLRRVGSEWKVFDLLDGIIE